MNKQINYYLHQPDFRKVSDRILSTQRKTNEQKCYENQQNVTYISDAKETSAQPENCN